MEMGGRCVRMGEDMDWVGCGARCGTDHLPETGPVGLPFFGLTPSTHGNHKTGAGKDQIAEKRMLIFRLNC